MAYSVGMVEGCVFERMFGVGRRPYALCFPPCLPWQLIKRLLWLMFGMFGRVWKVEEVERFLLVLQHKKIFPSLEDKLILKEAKGRHFSVKFLYRILDCLAETSFPSRSIWNPWVPQRWVFFFRGKPLGARC